MNSFTAIDTRTGQPADADKIWVECGNDARMGNEGFALQADGTVIICGRRGEFLYCPDYITATVLDIPDNTTQIEVPTAILNEICCDADLQAKIVALCAHHYDEHPESLLMQWWAKEMAAQRVEALTGGELAVKLKPPPAGAGTAEPL